MLAMLEQALLDNEVELRSERRTIRQVELMIARVEIYKSIIHLMKMDVSERKAA